MEEARLVVSAIVTLGAAFLILATRFGYLETKARSFCECRHEFNQHYVFPAGMKAASFDAPEGEPCKMCGCHQFKRNDKDKRNTPPVRFFPR